MDGISGTPLKEGYAYTNSSYSNYYGPYVYVLILRSNPIKVIEYYEGKITFYNSYFYKLEVNNPPAWLRKTTLIQ